MADFCRSLHADDGGAVIPIYTSAISAPSRCRHSIRAGLAVVASLLIAAVYRELDWKQLKEAIIEGGVQTAVVMLLVVSSVLIGVFLTEAQVPQTLAAGIGEFTRNMLVVLAILNVYFLVIGLFLHSAAAIILIVPIVMPLGNLVGIDPVHFGIVVTLNLGIGRQRRQWPACRLPRARWPRRTSGKSARSISISSRCCSRYCCW